MATTFCRRCGNDFQTSMYAIVCNICQAQEANEESRRKDRIRNDELVYESHKNNRLANEQFIRSQEIRAHQEREQSRLIEKQQKRYFKQQQLEQALHNFQMTALEAERIHAIKAQTEVIRRNGLTPEERAEEDESRRIAKQKKQQKKQLIKQRETQHAEQRQKYMSQGKLAAFMRGYYYSEQGSTDTNGTYWHSLSVEQQDALVDEFHKIILQERNAQQMTQQQQRTSMVNQQNELRYQRIQNIEKASKQPVGFWNSLKSIFN